MWNKLAKLSMLALLVAALLAPGAAEAKKNPQSAGDSATAGDQQPIKHKKHHKKHHGKIHKAHKRHGKKAKNQPAPSTGELLHETSLFSARLG